MLPGTVYNKAKALLLGALAPYSRHGGKRFSFVQAQKGKQQVFAPQRSSTFGSQSSLTSSTSSIKMLGAKAALKRSDADMQAFKKKLLALHKKIAAESRAEDALAAKKVAEETAVQKAKLLDLAKKASELIQSKRGGGSGGELARQIHDVNAEIGEAERELTHLKLRKYFPDPSGTKWKLRIRGDHKLYIGLKDLDIDNVSAKFKVQALSGRLVVHVEDLEASLHVYDMQMKGKTSSNILGSMLAPKLVILDLEGSIKLPVLFREAGDAKEVPVMPIFESTNDIFRDVKQSSPPPSSSSSSSSSSSTFSSPHPLMATKSSRSVASPAPPPKKGKWRMFSKKTKSPAPSGSGGGAQKAQRSGKGSGWEVLRDEAVFRLKVKKKIKGSVGGTVPTGLINFIVNSFIPKLVSNILEKVLPESLGPVLKSGSNSLLIAGSLELLGKVSGAAWTATLTSGDPAALRAKALLGEHSEIIGGMRGAPLSGFRAELLATMAGLVASDGNFKKFNLKALQHYIIRYSGSSSWPEILETWQALLSQKERQMLPEVEGDELSVAAGQADAGQGAGLGGWFSEVIEAVRELGTRPMQLRFAISNLDINSDIMQVVDFGLDMYYNAVVAEVEQLTKDQAKQSSRKPKRLSKFKKNVKAARKELQKQMKKTPETFLSNSLQVITFIRKLIQEVTTMLSQVSLSASVLLAGGVPVTVPSSSSLDQQASNGFGHDVQLSVGVSDLQLRGALPLLSLFTSHFQAVGSMMGISFETSRGTDSYNLVFTLHDKQSDNQKYSYRLSLSRLILLAFPDLNLQAGRVQFQGPLIPLTQIKRFMTKTSNLQLRALVNKMQLEFDAFSKRYEVEGIKGVKGKKTKDIKEEDQAETAQMQAPHLLREKKLNARALQVLLETQEEKLAAIAASASAPPKSVEYLADPDHEVRLGARVKVEVFQTPPAANLAGQSEEGKQRRIIHICHTPAPPTVAKVPETARKKSSYIEKTDLSWIKDSKLSVEEQRRKLQVDKGCIAFSSRLDLQEMFESIMAIL